MAEIIVKFDEPIDAPGGKTYFAHAVGKEVDGGLWDGWLEFQGVDDGADVLASGRETTQPQSPGPRILGAGVDQGLFAGGARSGHFAGAAVPRARACGGGAVAL